VKIGKWKDLGKFTIKPGHKVKAEILFKKIEDKELEKAKKYVTKYVKKEITEKGIKEKPQKLNLQIGTIISVENHPDAEKLYILHVDLGSETRQLVAGLKGVCKKEELEGKQIVVLTNLEPKELRGVKSQGMLLAAENGILLSPKGKVENGINLDGFVSDKIITFKEFQNIDIHIEDIEARKNGQIVICNGKRLRAGNVFISPEKKVKHGTKVL
jgi:methionyl-tRNA synthetase